MQRKFVVNLLFLITINLIVKPFWIFGIDRTVQNTLNSEIYGEYFVLFNVSLLFNILLDLGLTGYNTRSIAQNTSLLKERFPSIFIIKLMLAVGYFVATFIFAYTSGYSANRVQLLFWLAVNQTLVSFIQFIRSNFAGLHKYAIDSIFSVLDKIVMIAICSYLIWMQTAVEFTVYHFVWAQTISYGLVFISGLVLFFVLAKPLPVSIKDISIVQNFKNTLPYALLVITMTFYYRIDSVMLDQLLPQGAKEASVYAQSYRLMDAFSMIGVLFAGLLLPMFALQIEKKENIHQLLTTSFTLIFLPAISLVFFVIVNAGNILTLLYSYNPPQGPFVLQYLMWCFLFISCTYIFGTLLTANGSLKTLNKIAVTGLLLNIVMNYYLIPKTGAIGAAQASMITQLLVIVWQIISVKKIFKYQIPVKTVVTLFIYSLLILLFVVFTKNYFTLTMQLAGLILLSLLLIFGLRIVTLNELKILTKK
jgi:O-antigen/teichoic acid export membrane protein